MNAKKVLSIVLMVSSLLLSFPKKSEAGVVILGVGVTAAIVDHHEYSIGYGFAGLAAGTVVTLVGGVIGGLVMIKHPNTGVNIIVSSIVLDADGADSQNKIAAHLKEKLPFLDNEALVNDLASEVKKEYIKLGSPEKSYITLPATRVKEIVASADLNEAQVELVVKELN